MTAPRRLTLLLIIGLATMAIVPSAFAGGPAPPAIAPTVLAHFNQQLPTEQQLPTPNEVRLAQVHHPSAPNLRNGAHYGYAAASPWTVANSGSGSSNSGFEWVGVVLVALIAAAAAGLAYLTITRSPDRLSPHH